MLRRLRIWLFSLGDRRNSALFPELTFCETIEERADLWRDAYKRFLRKNRWRLAFRVLLLVILIEAPIWIAVIPFRGVNQTHLGVVVGAALVSGIAGAAIGSGILLVIRRDLRRELRLTLRERGHRPCLSCGYDLRGGESPRCPECGRDDDACASISP